MYRRLLVVLAVLGLFALAASGALAASPITRATIPMQDLGPDELGPLAPCLGGAAIVTLQGNGSLDVMFNAENGLLHARATVSGTFTATGADGSTYTGSYTRVQIGMGQGAALDLEQAQPRIFTVLVHGAGVNTATGAPIRFVEHQQLVLGPDLSTVRVNFDKVTCAQ